MQQQQQPGITSHPSMPDAVSASNSQITTTLDADATTTDTTTTTAGTLQLCSADSRLADRCLVNAELIWTPSISLSSADITSCLQPAVDSTIHTTVGPAAAAAAAAAADDDDDARADTRQQRCCAGYGVGEVLLPSSDLYIDWQTV